MKALRQQPRHAFLWQRYKEAADRDARERLVLAYAPLVDRIARRAAMKLPPHVEEAELVSYGLLGLLSAVDRFDPGRAIKFETFAISRIEGSIFDGLRSIDAASRSVRRAGREIADAGAKLEHRLQRRPTDHETAEALGVSKDELRQLLVRTSEASPVALEAHRPACAGDAAEASLLQGIADPDAADPADELVTSETRDELVEAIARLPERQRVALGLHYYDDLSLSEIGHVLGVTRSRAGQICASAISNLRSANGAESQR